MMRAMPTTGVDAAVQAVRNQGLGKPRYLELSGQSWTEKPVKTCDGLSALGVKATKLEKVEKYHWRQGDKIFEERVVNGQSAKVDTGRREPGKWVAKEELRPIEQK